MGDPGASIECNAGSPDSSRDRSGDEEGTACVSIARSRFHISGWRRYQWAALCIQCQQRADHSQPHVDEWLGRWIRQRGLI